jgi:hypothetical protein
VGTASFTASSKSIAHRIAQAIDGILNLADSLVVPSFCSLASPTALPMASFAAPLTSSIEPAILFLSMTALHSVCEDT